MGIVMVMMEWTPSFKTASMCQNGSGNTNPPKLSYCNNFSESWLCGVSDQVCVALSDFRDDGRSFPQSGPSVQCVVLAPNRRASRRISSMPKGCNDGRRLPTAAAASQAAFQALPRSRRNARNPGTSRSRSLSFRPSIRLGLIIRHGYCCDAHAALTSSSKSGCLSNSFKKRTNASDGFALPVS